ncbi:AAA family ATPase [Pseudoalteromonas sp. OFAV1]|uniref:replicative DNA helicase n=1 Tax=Pseudoalteromonas sp. OFAV1 TaxID=2908892 RepID=UPI001F3BC663|nr:DnaB-like helicase C-terminal domain-containing protein [Pseudoalteromonas sp. OFAV1]MCF2901830.1 AAA family ATPase [Pseudoalteromonas sp. OFAV1]
MISNIQLSLFSAALHDESALCTLFQKCSSNAFNGESKTVFNVLRAYFDNNKTIDTNLFIYECENAGINSQLAVDIVNARYNLDNIDDYINKVLFEATKFQVSQFHSKLHSKIEKSNSRDEILANVEELYQKSLLNDDFNSTSETVNIAERMDSYLEYLAENSKNKDGIIGIKTKFDGLNKLLRGLVPKDLIVLAGRPSMGKTALALSLFELSLMSGQGGLGFTLEMPWEQIISRFISSSATIKQDNLRTGSLTHSEQISFENIHSMIRDKEINFEINDKGGITLSEIKREAYRVHKKFQSIGGLKFIFIDYLQLMGDSDVSGDTRAERLGKITGGLKSLAKELNIPILLLSQLSRNLESRQDKRPINSDLRESGAIEQDADVIMFIYRDEVYNEKTNEPGIGEIIIGKQRNGPLGVVKTQFQGQYARYSNIPINS